MGIYNAKTPNVDLVLAADANILRDKFVGLASATPSPVADEVEYRNGLLRMWRYYSASEFSGPAAGWYAMNSGGADNFTRADSTATAGNLLTGQAWVAKAGTWGISSNKLYSVSDATDDMVWSDMLTNNPTVEAALSGTLNSAGTIRIPALVFRGVDTSNFLMVVLQNGSVVLYKKDGGAFTSLTSTGQTTTDGTSYTITVQCIGTAVNIWVSGVAKLSYTLAAGDAKYLEYTRCGINIRKAGAPATAARVSSFKVRQAVA